jgi:hypothetical protein
VDGAAVRGTQGVTGLELSGVGPLAAVRGPERVAGGGVQDGLLPVRFLNGQVGEFGVGVGDQIGDGLSCGGTGRRIGRQDPIAHPDVGYGFPGAVGEQDGSVAREAVGTGRAGGETVQDDPGYVDPPDFRLGNLRGTAYGVEVLRDAEPCLYDLAEPGEQQ